MSGIQLSAQDVAALLRAPCARAFVLYLLAEHVDDDGRVAVDRSTGFEHLVRLLREHLAYCQARKP